MQGLRSAIRCRWGAFSRLRTRRHSRRRSEQTRRCALTSTASPGQRGDRLSRIEGQAAAGDGKRRRATKVRSARSPTALSGGRIEFATRGYPDAFMVEEQSDRVPSRTFAGLQGCGYSQDVRDGCILIVPRGRSR